MAQSLTKEQQEAGLLESLKRISGSCSFQIKPNGVEIRIFLPNAEKPKKEVAHKVISYTSIDIQLARHLAEAIQSTNPHILIEEKLMPAWAAEISKIKVAGGADRSSFIKTTVDSVYRDDSDVFWRGRILNAKKFGEKFDVLAGQMLNKKQRSWL